MKIIMMIISLMLISTKSFSFEKIQVGPSLKIIDFPHPAQIGLESKILDGSLGFSVHKGMMPSVKLDKYDVKLDNLELAIKYHPWKGSFYLGTAIGNQKVKVSGTEEIQGQLVNLDGEIKGTYITPQIGWLWKYNSGLFLGMNLGWQFSSGAKTSVTASSPNISQVENTQEYKDAKQDIEDEGQKIGNKAIPSVGLLQIGWLF